MMKYHFFFLMICLCVTNVKSQLNQVATPTIIPNNPLTINDFAKISNKVNLGSVGYKISTTTSVNQNTKKISIKSHYCDGPSPGGQPVRDTIALGYLAVGVYQCTFTAYYGSSVFSNCNVSDSAKQYFTINVLATSIFENNSIIENVSLFPNPSSNKFTVSFNKNSKATLFAINTLGQTIFTETTGKEILDVDCGNWQIGVYFITVITSDGKKVFKFIKE